MRYGDEGEREIGIPRLLAFVNDIAHHKLDLCRIRIAADLMSFERMARAVAEYAEDCIAAEIDFRQWTLVIDGFVPAKAGQLVLKLFPAFSRANDEHATLPQDVCG